MTEIVDPPARPGGDPPARPGGDPTTRPAPLPRRRYFDIMGAAPTAVTIVTTLAGLNSSDGEPEAGRRPDGPARPVGLTVSAVTSISAEPPILAICLDARSRTLPVIERAGRFAVNFLRGDRADLAERFASPGVDRFAGVAWRSGATDAPILVEDALAWAECLIEGTLVVGDHVVIFGLVVAGASPPPGSRPLMYFRHGFSAWAGPVEDARAAVEGTGPDDGSVMSGHRGGSDLQTRRRGS